MQDDMDARESFISQSAPAEIARGYVWKSATPLLCVCSLLLAQTAHAGQLAQQTARLPELPAPPQGTTQWVARSMRMNGVPMTIKIFETHLAPDELFGFYEEEASRWGRNEFHREIRGSEQLLSIRSRRYLITIEAKRTIAGSEGTITVSEPPELATAKLSSRFPHPESARVVNCQQYEDDGIEAEHLSLASSRAPAVEAQAFVQHLTQAGWQILRQESMQTSRGIVIEAQLGAQLAQLTLTADASRLAATAIVVVWRKA